MVDTHADLGEGPVDPAQVVADDRTVEGLRAGQVPVGPTGKVEALVTLLAGWRASVVSP